MTSAIKNPGMKYAIMHAPMRSDTPSLTDLPDACSTVCSVCTWSAPALALAPPCKACFATAGVSIYRLRMTIRKHLSTVRYINKRYTAQGQCGTALAVTEYRFVFAIESQ